MSGGKCIVCGNPQLPKWFFCRSCKRLWEKDKVLEKAPFDAAEWAGKIAQKKFSRRIRVLAKTANSYADLASSRSVLIEELTHQLTEALSKIYVLESERKVKRD